MKNISLNAYKLARGEASREIGEAVQKAMDKFNETTGLHITNVHVDIRVHKYLKETDTVFLIGAGVDTSFEG